MHLDLLESLGKIIRPEVSANAARPGWLPISADAPVPVPVLIDAVIRVLSGGLYGSEEDLQARLKASGVPFDPQDLSVALGRLLDSGRLTRPKPRPTVENPTPSRSLVMASLPGGFSQSSDRFDHIDGLAANVHASIKRRSDRFENDDQPEQWLAVDEVEYRAEDLQAALEQLELSGWLSRPHRLREWPSDPLPGYLITPRWDRGY
jgi:hypothetical protein